MKTYLTLGILFAVVTAAIASPDTDAIKARETAAWQAFKDKNVAAFQKLLSPEMRAVYDTGIKTVQGELANMQKMVITSFTISDFNAVAVGDDTIVATYKVASQATAEGKDVSGNLNAGSVWKKINGEWLAIFHTDSKVAPAK